MRTSFSSVLNDQLDKATIIHIFETGFNSSFT